MSHVYNTKRDKNKIGVGQKHMSFNIQSIYLRYHKYYKREDQTKDQNKLIRNRH